jgi:hypothetical protein
MIVPLIREFVAAPVLSEIVTHPETWPAAVGILSEAKIREGNPGLQSGILWVPALPAKFGAAVEKVLFTVPGGLRVAAEAAAWAGAEA